MRWLVGILVACALTAPAQAQTQDLGGSRPQPPAGTRYVGIGHVAIAVPRSWPDGYVSCGPQRHGVVVIDFPGTRTCEGVYPSIASVQIDEVPYLGQQLRVPTRCSGRGDEHVCEGARSIDEYVGDDDVVERFVVRSPRGAAYVDDILSRIHSFDSELAVPGWQVPQAVAGPYASAYVALLTSSGFHVRTVMRRGGRPGSVLSVRPAVGTMLAPGATVTVARTRAASDDAPVGHQYVGIGRAVIVAPDAWPIGHHQCVDDGVVLDQIGPPDCLPARREDAGSLAVLPFYPGETYSHAHPGTVDGVRVYYSAMTSDTDVAGTRAWFEQAYVPAYRGVFEAESTRSPTDVRRLLRGLHILEHRVAVPFAHSSPGQPPQTVAQLLRRLRALGLRPDLELAVGTDRGSPVAAVSPAGGTLADPGATVTVHTRSPNR